MRRRRSQIRRATPRSRRSIPDRSAPMRLRRAAGFCRSRRSSPECSRASRDRSSRNRGCGDMPRRRRCRPRSRDRSPRDRSPRRRRPSAHIRADAPSTSWSWFSCVIASLIFCADVSIAPAAFFALDMACPGAPSSDPATTSSRDRAPHRRLRGREQILDLLLELARSPAFVRSSPLPRPREQGKARRVSSASA